MRPAITRSAVLLASTTLLVVSFARVGRAASGPATSDVPQCVATIRTSTTGSPTRWIVPQNHRDVRTNAGFFFSVTAEGALRMTVKAGDLEADKTVHRDGRFRLVLQAGDDTVSVSGVPGAVEVERRSQRGPRLDIARATDEDWLRVQVLLAGSKAVRLFRTLAYNLDAETFKTPAGPAVLTSDALLGVLVGDVGAIGRLARQIHAAYQAKIRPAALRQEFLGCFRKYSEAVNTAFEEYGGCVLSFYPWDPRIYLCDFEWLLKVESAWFQFLACSAFPWME